MDADSPAPREEPTSSSKDTSRESTAKRTSSEPSSPSTKAQKPNKKGGEKRAAERPLEEIVEDDLLKELMGSLPTLHEVPLVAGYPETGTVRYPSLRRAHRRGTASGEGKGGPRPRA